MVDVKSIEWNEEFFRDGKADMKFEVFFVDGTVDEFYTGLEEGISIRNGLRKGILTQINSESLSRDNEKMHGDIDRNGYVLYMKHVKYIRYYHRKKVK